VSEDNFADAPQTIGEIRSDKSRSARDWTPRDALISLLREIDRGEANPDTIAIFYRERTRQKTAFVIAGADPDATVGVAYEGIHRILRAREGR
jgi:hypothetical protein